MNIDQLQMMEEFRDYCASRGNDTINHRFEGCASFDHCAVGDFARFKGLNAIDMWEEHICDALLNVCGVDLYNTIGSWVDAERDIPTYHKLTVRLTACIELYKVTNEL